MSFASVQGTSGCVVALLEWLGDGQCDYGDYNTAVGCCCRGYDATMEISCVVDATSACVSLNHFSG